MSEKEVLSQNSTWKNAEKRATAAENALDKAKPQFKGKAPDKTKPFDEWYEDPNKMMERLAREASKRDCGSVTRG